MASERAEDLRILWYLNGTDGTVPWQDDPQLRFAPSLGHLTEVARELDELGY